MKFAVLRSQYSANRVLVVWARKEENLNIGKPQKAETYSMDSHTNGELIGTECGANTRRAKYSEAMKGKNMQMSQIHPIARRQKRKQSDRDSPSVPDPKRGFTVEFSYEKSLQIFFLMFQKQPIAFCWKNTNTHEVWIESPRERIINEDEVSNNKV